MVRIFPKTRWGWVRFAVPAAVLLGLLTWFLFIPGTRYLSYAPAEGDIVFQSLPHADLVDAIEGITGSPYSHCGVVVKENGKWVVVEAIGEVRKTPLLRWVLRGRGRGRFAAYRLKAEHRAHISKFIEALEPFVGRPYDFQYRMDDDRIYCSELCYKAWKDVTGEQMGELKALGDMNWQPYEGTIRKYEDGPPPLTRLIITPKHLAEASQLEKVYGRGY